MGKKVLVDAAGKVKLFNNKVIIAGDHDNCCCCSCLCDQCLVLDMSVWTALLGGGHGWVSLPTMTIGPNGASSTDTDNQKTCTFCGKITLSSGGDISQCTSLTITFTNTKTLDETGECQQVWTMRWVDRLYDPVPIIDLVTDTGQLIVPIVGDCPDIDASQIQAALIAFSSTYDPASPTDGTIRIDNASLTTAGSPCAATDAGCPGEVLAGNCDSGTALPPVPCNCCLQCDCEFCGDGGVGVAQVTVVIPTFVGSPLTSYSTNAVAQGGGICGNFLGVSTEDPDTTIDASLGCNEDGTGRTWFVTVIGPWGSFATSSPGDCGGAFNFDDPSPGTFVNTANSTKGEVACL